MIIEKWYQKLKFYERFSKIHPTKRGNASENSNHISSITYAALKKTKIIFVITSSRTKIDQSNLHCSHRFAMWAKNQNSVPPIWRISGYFQKKWKLEGVILGPPKVGCFTEIQNWNNTAQRWFLALKNLNFSAVQSRINAVHRLSSNEHHWIKSESFLNQSWMSLKRQWDSSVHEIGDNFSPVQWCSKRERQNCNLRYNQRNVSRKVNELGSYNKRS